MPNTDKPMGFFPVNPNARMRPYAISPTNSEILRGTVMEIPTAGYASEMAAGGSTPMIGIAAEYIAANSGGYMNIWDDPNETFKCQLDGVGTALTVADVGRCFQHVSTHTSNNGVNSATELDQSSNATTATHTFKLAGLSRETDLEAGTANAWGNHAKVLVQPNFHRLRSTTGI
jgi:hypothetical protein